MISLAVIIIGFSADIGYLLGDSKEHCRTYKGTRTRAAIVFIVGFWMLDLANNTVQGPARALLADLAGPDQRNSANAIFCSWMAVGNVLGFSAGASGKWHRWFPFLMSRSCCEACGNLKAAFLVAVALKAAGEICLLTNSVSAEDMAYPNDPRVPIKVDDDLKQLFRGIELPRDMLDIDKDLQKNGMKPATNTAFPTIPSKIRRNMKLAREPS